MAAILLPMTNRVETMGLRMGYPRKKLRLCGLVAVVAVAILSASLSTLEGWAQDTAKRPQVEVAVIRPSAPGGGDSGNVNIQPGRFMAHNLPVRRLMYIAYKVKADQIIGGPAWLNSDAYDITATGENMGGDNFPLMLQTLLEERFGLKVHRETKEGPVYDLTVAKGGVKMQPTKPGSCIPFDLGKPPAQGQRRCGMWQGIHAGLRRGTGISMTDTAGVGFQSLTGQLSLVLDKPVIDQTGLSGLFDVDLTWAPEENLAKAAFPGSSGQPVADEGPSIFTAVREQLGLELKSGKGPITVLVIDGVERPSEN